MDARARVGVAALAVGAILGLSAFVLAPDERPRAERSEPGPPAENPISPETSPDREHAAPSPAATRLARVVQARRARLANAPARAEGSEEPPDAETCDEACWGTIGMQVELADVVSGCREELPAELAETGGTTRFRARVLAEPGLGAVIESVEVVEDTIELTAFTECIVESAPLAELDDPGSPVAEDFVFRFSAGPPRNPANEFLAAHPELVEGDPLLGPLAARDPSERPSAEEATAFARWVSQHEHARDAFSTWVQEQGIDLSNVRVNGAG